MTNECERGNGQKLMKIQLLKITLVVNEAIWYIFLEVKTAHVFQTFQIYDNDYDWSQIGVDIVFNSLP